jgi:hypothetical protein
MNTSKLFNNLHSFINWQRIKFRNTKRPLEKEYDNWIKAGKPYSPPHIVKQKTIRSFQNKFNTNVLVETGTFMGEMIYAQRNIFKKIYSIELSEELHLAAKRRLNKYQHVELLQGDSGEVLFNLVPKIDEPAIFWLDGHYSGFETAKGELATPIEKELETILNSDLAHIILIDDARLFIGQDDYPTIEQIKNSVSTKKKNITFNVEDDIIRIVPNF